MEKIDLTSNGKSFLELTDKLLKATNKIFSSPEVAVIGLIVTAMHLAQEHDIPDEFVQNALTALDQVCNQEGLAE